MMEAGASFSTSRRGVLPDIIAYTDGACSGNPGPGGWGVLLVAKDGSDVIREKELCGGEADTTNNRMELLAAIRALEALSRSTRITIVTDSQYLRNGITNWITNWKRRGWKTASDLPVKNRDLWERLDKIRNQHSVRWEWVKGHRGHPENERSDGLARQGMRPYAVAKSDRVATPGQEKTAT